MSEQRRRFQSLKQRLVERVRMRVEANLLPPDAQREGLQKTSPLRVNNRTRSASRDTISRMPSCFTS